MPSLTMILGAIAVPLVAVAAAPLRPDYAACYGDAACYAKLKARDAEPARPDYAACYGDAACYAKLEARDAEAAAKGVEYAAYFEYSKRAAAPFDPHPEPPSKREADAARPDYASCYGDAACYAKRDAI